MAIFPAAIILVNDDLVESTLDKLVRQLYIDEVVDGYVFDTRVGLNPTYAEDYKKENKRLLVKRSFFEIENRMIFDVVIFVKNGLASIEKNNFGPPYGSYSLLNLTWRDLGILKDNRSLM